MYRSVSLLNV